MSNDRILPGTSIPNPTSVSNHCQQHLEGAAGQVTIQKCPWDLSVWAFSPFQVIPGTQEPTMQQIRVWASGYRKTSDSKDLSRKEGACSLWPERHCRPQFLLCEREAEQLEYMGKLAIERTHGICQVLCGGWTRSTLPHGRWIEVNGRECRTIIFSEFYSYHFFIQKNKLLNLKHTDPRPATAYA